jgi:hypothetical protein
MMPLDCTVHVPPCDAHDAARMAQAMMLSHRFNWREAGKAVDGAVACALDARLCDKPGSSTGAAASGMDRAAAIAKQDIDVRIMG